MNPTDRARNEEFSLWTIPQNRLQPILKFLESVVEISSLLQDFQLTKIEDDKNPFRVCINSESCEELA